MARVWTLEGNKKKQLRLNQAEEIRSRRLNRDTQEGNSRTSHKLTNRGRSNTQQLSQTLKNYRNESSHSMCPVSTAISAEHHQHQHYSNVSKEEAPANAE